MWFSIYILITLQAKDWIHVAKQKCQWDCQILQQPNEGSADSRPGQSCILHWVRHEAPGCQALEITIHGSWVVPVPLVGYHCFLIGCNMPCHIHSVQNHISHLEELEKAAHFWRQREEGLDRPRWLIMVYCFQIYHHLTFAHVTH